MGWGGCNVLTQKNHRKVVEMNNAFSRIFVCSKCNCRGKTILVHATAMLNDHLMIKFVQNNNGIMLMICHCRCLNIYWLTHIMINKYRQETTFFLPLKHVYIFFLLVKNTHFILCFPEVQSRGQELYMTFANNIGTILNGLFEIAVALNGWYWKR